MHSSLVEAGERKQKLIRKKEINKHSLPVVRDTDEAPRDHPLMRQRHVEVKEDEVSVQHVLVRIGATCGPLG